MGQHTILVVDDEEQIRRMLREMLEREGFRVEEAPDGKFAAARYREAPSDLIITDLIMPEQEGLGLIVELRKDFPDLKIIAMSGGGRIRAEEYLPIASKLGAFRTLRKPFSRQDLLAVVREALAG